MLDIEKLRSILERKEVEKLLCQLDEILAKEEDLPNISDMIESYISKESKSNMYIEPVNVRCESTGCSYNGYRLAYDFDDEKLVDGIYICKDSMVGVALVEKLREMSYMGYNLSQKKEWVREDVVI